MDKSAKEKRLKSPRSRKHSGDAASLEALEVVTSALEEVMLLYGRNRLAPYPYEHTTWRAARTAAHLGRELLTRLKKGQEVF